MGWEVECFKRGPGGRTRFSTAWASRAGDGPGFTRCPAGERRPSVDEKTRSDEGKEEEEESPLESKGRGKARLRLDLCCTVLQDFFGFHLAVLCTARPCSLTPQRSHASF